MKIEWEAIERDALYHTWSVYFIADADHPWPIGYEGRKEVIADGLSEKGARLIATARNACYLVNPSNPLAVAKSINEMYEALKLLVTLTLHETPDLVKSAIDDAEKALAKVEEG